MWQSQMLDINIVTRDYIPDFSAVARLSSDIAESTAQQNIKVNVITGRPYYHYQDTKKTASGGFTKSEDIKDHNMSIEENHLNHLGRPSEQNKPVLHYVPCTSFNKDVLTLRLVNELTFAVSVFFLLFFSRRRFTILTSNPFSVQIAGLLLNKLKGLHYGLINFEAIPELFLSSGILKKNSFFYRILDKISIKVLRNADLIIAITQNMKELIEKKSGAEAIHIPLWVDETRIRPLDLKENNTAKHLGLDRGFIISYAGNFGRYMDIETVLEAGKNLNDARMVFIGNGAKLGLIKDYVKKYGNIERYDYISREHNNEAINIGDVVLVLSNKADEDYVIPSKVFEAMAAGKPIIAVAKQGSELRKTVEASGAGIAVNPGDVRGLKDAVIKMHHDEAFRKECGKKARIFIEAKHTRRSIMKRYIKLLIDAGSGSFEGM